jgi:hypothetical protein
MFRKIYPVLAVLFALDLLAGLILFFVGGPGQGSLSWDIATKKSVMTVAYKAYANPSAGDGRWFLSKTIFRNKGPGPVRNLQVSYQIPDYVGWTTPEKYDEILAGQTIIDLYYPKLPAKVAELTSPQSATLEIKIAYEEGSGKMKESVEKRNFDLRGMNEIEYTSMPPEEIVTWYDVFQNTDLLAAFITADDPVLTTFAAEITKWAGGTTAGAGGGTREVLRLMETFYTYQCVSGMHYASAKGVPEKRGDAYTSLVQSIRLPRDVVRSNSGLCIELAILWAAVMEHLGVHTYVVVIPGHAFALVQDESGSLIPIECTGIGGAGIGGSVPFKKALESAQKTLAEAQIMKIIDPRKLQSGGIRPPELPRLSDKEIQEIIDKRMEQARAKAQAPPRTEPPAAPPPGAAAESFQVWTQPDGLYSVGYPRSWVTKGAALRQIQQQVPWYAYAAAHPVSGSSVELFHWKWLSSIAEAKSQIEGLLARGGSSLNLPSQESITMGGYRGIVCVGVMTNSSGVEEAVKGILVSTRSGVVAVWVSCPRAIVQQESSVLEKVLATFKVK